MKIKKFPAFMNDRRIYQIKTHGPKRHTMVYFSNGTYSCSCNAEQGSNTLIFTTHPNLRERP